MSDESGFSVEEIKSSAQELLRSGQDIRARLHDLTVKALARRDLAEQEIREVLAAITEGVSLGAAQRADEVRAAITDAIGGMDDALAHAAEATRLALGEASSHAQDFAEHDLKESLDELRKLEEVFLDTVSRVAQSASGMVRQEMAAVAEHARRTGTGTGVRAKAVAEELANRLRATAHGAGDAGKRAAREVGSRVAMLASRKLADIAAKMEEKAQAIKPHP